MVNKILFFLFFCPFIIVAQKSKIEQINNNFATGKSILEKENFDKAIDYFNIGLTESNAINNDSLIAIGNFYLGDYFLKKKDYQKSLAFTNTSLIIFEGLKDSLETLNCHRRLAKIYRKKSDFKNALAYNFKSLKINEQFNNEIGIAEDLNVLGSIYSRTRDFVAAEFHLKRALALNRKNSNVKGIVDNLSNLGAVSQRTNKFDEAISLYKEALTLAKKLDLKRNESILLGNIGSTARSQGKYTISLDYLFKALKLKKELKRDGSTAHTCNDISETYLKMEDYLKAKEYALLAIEFSKDENLESEMYAYFLVSKASYKNGDYKSSYENMRLYSLLKDSVFNINKSKSINELQIKYESEKRDFEISAQKSNIAFLNEKNKVKNQWLLFGGLGLVSFFGFIMLYRSRNAANKREYLQEQFSQDLLVAQEHERTRISKDLHDSVGQQLTLIKRKAQNLNQDELSSLTNTALEEVRSISRNLYPSTLKQLGLTESIEQLLYDFDEETEMFFSVDIDNINKELNEEKTLNFYKFIQESVTNVLKHSMAKTMALTIHENKDYIEVLIKDNGVGFDDVEALKQKSLGLKTMSERIRILKGTLTIKSEKGNGTSISAQIPV